VQCSAGVGTGIHWDMVNRKFDRLVESSYQRVYNDMLQIYIFTSWTLY
jgi:hypothetical protein